MGTLCTQIILFVLLLPLVHFGHAIVGTSDSNLGVGKPKIQCLEAERRALLSIKEHLHNIKDGANDLLSSWGNDEGRKECCKWVGIRCDNNSGHVVWLDLSPSTLGTSEDQDFSLRGKISPSLLELRYLTHLDLSYIDFNGSQIPSEIGILSQLRYLNLAYNSFYGEIPLQLANLSHLHFLDLGYNVLMTTKNLEWLPHLSSLRYLDLSRVNLSRANNWIQIVNRLPSLTRLQLYHCSLPNISKNPSYLSFVNSSTSLAFLDLSGNDLSASMYQWLFNFRNTLHLDLSFNQLECSISQALSKMTSLTFLDLSHNNLNCSITEALGKMSTALTYLALQSNKLKGPIPEALSEMTALKDLYLFQNMLEGEIPKSVWNMSTLQSFFVQSNNLSGNLSETTFRQLKHLEYLYLSGNSFQGVISEAHFLGLSKLKGLDLSLLTLNISSEWNPPFQLDYIFLASCKLGPLFPKWLQTQKSISFLDISNCGISDSIPNWFWDLSSGASDMDLSNNQIYGEIGSSSLEFQPYFRIDLSSNQLGGSIPSFLFKGATLNLSQNGFSKLDFLCEINGESPLGSLDISHNKLFGELPDCWSRFNELQLLILTNNKLSGKVPSSIGSLPMVETLKLSNNNFTGELPSTLKNCTKLVSIDFGENKLSGPIPTWVGKSFPQLFALSLRSNHFGGSIPSSLCHLSKLQILDLSLNEITGSIPICLGSFVALKEKRKTGTTTITHEYISSQTSGVRIVAHYHDKFRLVWKGKIEEFENILWLVKSIDLSSNKLMGEIPKEMADLVELISLNLSGNNLSGHIPSKIGQLRYLEFLDLSGNHLVGQLPLSLAQIDRLTKLDVSNNNLSGKIPTSTQLQSFSSDAYEGNPLLCGEPLPNKCQKVQERTSGSDIEEGDDQILTQGFYIAMALGFAISFWGVSGTLIFHKSFRYKSSFELLNDVGDFIRITTTIYKAKLLLRTIKS